jgi:glycosyltransferase involved in cell wall biosynthesis
MMNVTLLGPAHPFRGGLAHHTTLLYRAFARRGPARLVSFTRQYPRWLFPGASDRDTSAAPLAAPEAERLLDPLDPRSWWATARTIAAPPPDLLVVPWWLAYWAPSLGTVVRRVRRLAPRTRIVFVCHNVVPHERTPLSAPLTRWALAPGDAYVVHAQEQAAALRALLPAAVVRVTPHPLYDMFVPAEMPARAAARAALGLPADAPVALFFGFIRPYKGLDDLLAALPAACAAVPGLRLLVAGESWGDPRDHLARAGALGLGDAVTFVNRYIPNEEVAPYFAAADVAVLPYREATGSGVAALAYGFGLPVIATAVGGLGEIVTGEVSGLLVPPGDPAALAAALARYFGEGLRVRLAAGVAAQRDALSWERLAEVVEQAGRG